LVLLIYWKETYCSIFSVMESSAEIPKVLLAKMAYHTKKLCGDTVSCLWRVQKRLLLRCGS